MAAPIPSPVGVILTQIETVIIQEVINMIQQGKIIKIFNDTSEFIYHKIDQIDLSKNQVVYIDCKNYPHLLDRNTLQTEIVKKIDAVKNIDLSDTLAKTIKNPAQVSNHKFVTF